MPQAIIIDNYGDADTLSLRSIESAIPGPGELSLRQLAIGINFHDVYVRSGLYKTLDLPGIPGCEATAVVEAVGPGVETIQAGDTIAYVTGPPYGAYASHRILPEHAAVVLPGSLDVDLIAANFLRALTVEMLVNSVSQLKTGMTILVHAAAGGVGRLLCQTAQSLGVKVIGTVGSAEKAEIALRNGCEFPILYREVDFADVVLSHTEGKGVDVVFDSIGHDTFPASFRSLRLCGHLVNFGQSSGPVEPIDMASLATKSLSISRPILFHYLKDNDRYRTMARRVFKSFENANLRAEKPITLSLGKASEAHELLESKTVNTGIVLKPAS